MASETGTPSDRLMRLALGYMDARAVYVAAKLGIADSLKDGPKTARELVRGVEADGEALYRVLRVLARLGVLSLDDEARFSLTRVGRALLRDDPQSIRNYIIHLHELVYPYAGDLLLAVQTGEPAAEQILGMPYFDWIEQIEENARIVHAGLGDRSRIDTAAILDAYDFSDCGKIVDVAGGNGAFLAALLARNPHLSAVLFERDFAIEAARESFGDKLTRCEFVVGDFFQSVPAGGDTYVMKLVIHDWPDDRAAVILETCRRAMEQGKRLLLIEGLVGTDGEASFTDIMDLVMLTFFHGRERTEAEFTGLLTDAGFRLRRVIPSTSPLSVLEAVAV